jgi:parvulin-like peptidyl-prolyl isomerase
MYYAAHKDDYVEPEMVVVTEISLKDEEKAKEVMEKIKGGADFTELAKEMDAKGESSGPGQGNEGKTRPFSKSSFRNAQNFAETVFSLEVGQMSDIIVQPLGEETYYMIARLDERIPPRQKELSEVESRIRRIVEKERKKERMDTWLQALKVQKKFQLYPDRIPEPAEAEVEEAEAGEEKAEEAVEKTEETEAAEEAVETTEETEEAAETEDEQETPDETAEEEK